MLKIGEFSKIAQVSGRLLRYYDQIDLFKPAYTDPFTGHRYYKASQLSHLNRIMALKELGLNLSQISQMLAENISTEELRGMLTMKKAQVEQTLQDEIVRLQRIESRLRQIEQGENFDAYDVIIKSIPPAIIVSARELVPSLVAGWQTFGQAYPIARRRQNLGACVVIIHSDILDDEEIDVEFGFLVKSGSMKALTVPGTNYRLTQGQLPAINRAATLVHEGDPQGVMTAYAALATWIEDNGYLISGSTRELFYQVSPFDDGEGIVMELQFPIEEQGVKAI